MTDIELHHLEPWDRQAEETDKAWQYFQIYRNLGYGRTYKKVADAVNVSDSNIHTYAKKHNWAERVHQWDIYQDKIFQAERAYALKEMAYKQAENINNAIQAMMVPINGLLDRATDPDLKAEFLRTDLDDLIKAAQASARALKSLTAAERSAWGAPSEITQVQTTVSGEVSHKVDDDQLQELANLYHRYLGDGREGQGEAEDIIDAEVIEVQRNDAAS